MSESTAIARAKPLKEQLAVYREPVQRLAAKGVEADFILTAALLVVNQSPDLQRCSVASIGQSVMRIAQWGLQPGVTAHLVPFGQTCTAVADYKGLIQLMRECGVRDVDAQVVREGDVFEWELGLTPALRHVPGHTRGQIVAAYVIVRLPHNVVKFEVMDAADINAIRQKHSKQWKKDALPEWYARKTVVRRAAKYVPLHSAKLAAALSQDEALPEAEVSEIEGEITPIAEHLPLRAPTSRMDHDAAGAEFGAERQVAQRVVGTPAAPPETWLGDEFTEVAYDPDA
jgi:recombination protein RecT